MLNYKDLYDGFFSIMSNTKEYSEDLLSITQKWTNVFQTFYLNQILPIPGSSNVNLFPSLQIFKSNLLFAIKEQIVKQQLEIIIKTLHFGICTGVTMTGIYTTTPPSISLNLQHCFNSKFSIENICNLLAITIFTWVSSTFSIQNSSGAMIKWM